MRHRTKINNIFCGVLLLVAGAAMMLAMPDRAWSQYYSSRSRIAELDAFLQDHPKASTELQQNPGLVYNRKWLDKHPDVEHFLKRRPELREAIARSPGRVFGSYDRFDRRYDWRDRDRFDRPWGSQHQ
jgi:hypothetical protein